MIPTSCVACIVDEIMPMKHPAQDCSLALLAFINDHGLSPFINVFNLHNGPTR